jgi:hypothetical protein
LPLELAIGAVTIQTPRSPRMGFRGGAAPPIPARKAGPRSILEPVANISGYRLSNWFLTARSGACATGPTTPVPAGRAHPLVISSYSKLAMIAGPRASIHCDVVSAAGAVTRFSLAALGDRTWGLESRRISLHVSCNGPYHYWNAPGRSHCPRRHHVRLGSRGIAEPCRCGGEAAYSL